jgi:hypothetical protein
MSSLLATSNVLRARSQSFSGAIDKLKKHRNKKKEGEGSECQTTTA